MINESVLLLVLALIAQSLFQKVHNEWNTLLPDMMMYTGESDAALIDKITKFYIDSPDNIGNMDKFVNLTNLFSDRIFLHGTHEAVNIQAKYSPVYLYYFSYEGSFSLTNLLLALKGKFPSKIELMYFFGSRWIERNIFGREPHHYGASHFDEVPLLFPLKARGSTISKTDVDYEMSRDLVKLWVGFAKDE